MLVSMWTVWLSCTVKSAAAVNGAGPSSNGANLIRIPPERERASVWTVLPCTHSSQLKVTGQRGKRSRRGLHQQQKTTLSWQPCDFSSALVNGPLEREDCKIGNDSFAFPLHKWTVQRKLMLKKKAAIEVGFELKGRLGARGALITNTGHCSPHWCSRWLNKKESKQTILTTLAAFNKVSTWKLIKICND